MSYKRHPLAATVEDPEAFRCWILTLDSNQIVELEGSAYLIWHAAFSAHDPDSLVANLCHEFKWEQREVAQGIKDFVAELVAREVLVEEIE